MPTRHRNPDGSLSYTQTADEKAQTQSQQNIKQLFRNVKKLTERVESLESTVSKLKEELKTLTEEKASEQVNNTNSSSSEPKKFKVIL